MKLKKKCISGILAAVMAMGSLAVGNVNAAVLGDANNDGKLNIRDSAYIVKMALQGKTSSLPAAADYNGDGMRRR